MIDLEQSEMMDWRMEWRQWLTANLVFRGLPKSFIHGHAYKSIKHPRWYSIWLEYQLAELLYDMDYDILDKQ